MVSEIPAREEEYEHCPFSPLHHKNTDSRRPVSGSVPGSSLCNRTDSSGRQRPVPHAFSRIAMRISVRRSGRRAGRFCRPLVPHPAFWHAPLPFQRVHGLELATYGLLSGLLYRALPRKNICLYVSLLVSMLAGRLIWGVFRALLSEVFGAPLSLELFLTVSFLNAIPGILLQLILIPTLVLALRRSGRLED